MHDLEFSNFSEMNFRILNSSRRTVKWAPGIVHPIRSGKKVALLRARCHSDAPNPFFKILMGITGPVEDSSYVKTQRSHIWALGTAEFNDDSNGYDHLVVGYHYGLC